MFNSTPMPGEDLESAEAREKERERQAIANGENFNPNITNEDAEKFSNLGNEVPFAGDNVIENIAYAVTEPFIIPVRFLLERIEWVRNAPLDVSFFVTFLIISLLFDAVSP